MRTTRSPVSPEDLLAHVEPGTDVICPVANGEPRAFMDALESAAADGRLEGVRVHQLLALRERRYHSGIWSDRLRHVSYFLSAPLRSHFESGAIDLVPNDFHSVPAILRRSCRNPLLAAAVSPPDAHGRVGLGVAADYAAALLGEVPTVLEVNPHMPSTTGEHGVALAEAADWCEAGTEMVQVADPEPTDVDRAIAELVAERIPDGATLQIGIGAVPALVAGLLGGHRDLGIHTELLGDAVMHLVESGAVTGHHKARERGLVTTTTVMGTDELYRWADGNSTLFMLPVDISNDPRVIAQHPRFCAVNATMQVDLLGQCASESLGTHYVSSTGGQADFMRGAQLGDDGQSFIVTHSTAHVAATAEAPEHSVSRIVGTLSEGAVVSAHKNLVDKVVTEHGVAELAGATAAERARRLVAVAAPEFREDLERAARERNLW